MRTPLDEVLSGRDERAACQRRLLADAACEAFVCQISLNIPGYPKRLPGDAATVGRLRDKFLAGYGKKYMADSFIENGAGICWIGLFNGDGDEGRAAKMCAVDVEESCPGGRAADIDIVSRRGALSRVDIGRSARKCVICGKDAKSCSREASHSNAELRAAIAGLLEKI